jgi:hypothetical protein
MQRIALYTTIYPAVVQFLPDWYRSLTEQTDRDYELWVGLDQIEPVDIEDAIGARLDARWVKSSLGSTPAQIREHSLARIVDAFDAVVLVDSDDILHPTRIAAARSALQSSDVNACALRLVDHSGQDIGKTLTLPQERTVDETLPRNNVFGFSNSAYRSSLLRKCLPIPAESILVDWFLATRAWLLGARLDFDDNVRMDYRQHGANTAGIRFPFKAEQIIQSTSRVREHYHLLRNAPTEKVLPERWTRIVEAAEDVELFWDQVVSNPQRLDGYVCHLNSLQPQDVWWWEVAQPKLQWFWNKHAGETYEACRN